MKRKLITLFLALCCTFSFSAITACVYDESFFNPVSGSSSSIGNIEPNEEAHTHDFNIPKKGVTYHWTECSCGAQTEKVAHTFVEGVCSCGAEEINETEGLAYTLSDDGTYYILSGIGTATDTDIVIPATYNNLPVSAIGEKAFLTCVNLISVTIPDSIISIGMTAFGECSGLMEITIPDSVTSIEDYAFAACGNLRSATIGNSVTSIGVYAFYDCSSLTSVILLKSITSIGDYAFGCCYKLVEVINKSSLSITAGSEDCGYVAYYAKQVITDEKDSNIIKENDYIFYNDNGSYSLLGYMGNQVELILPDTINGNTYAIYQFAFYRCYYLTSITILDCVTSIGKGAFSFCSSLTDIIIPQSVTSVEMGAFIACRNLTSVTFETTNGWKAGDTVLSSTDLADSGKAAKYLTDTYNSYTWTRNEE